MGEEAAREGVYHDLNQHATVEKTASQDSGHLALHAGPSGHGWE